MINFHKVNEHLYRGGSLTPQDVLHLKEKYGIEKIVSLDAEVAKRIDRACKLLNIKHVKIPIDIGKKSSLIKFLHYGIKNLLGGEKVFVGCMQGKDRTGLAVAMYRCEHDHWSCGKALKEAKKYGFGMGVDPKVIKLYKKLIAQSCGCKDEDMSFAYDIVSNQREYPSDYADYSLGAWEQQSWGPYEDYRVREFPYADTYPNAGDQYPSREDFGLDDSDALNVENIDVPQVGQFDQNTQGISGAGPSMMGSGTII
jgi:protein tyrosine/serine phosphatase